MANASTASGSSTTSKECERGKGDRERTPTLFDNRFEKLLRRRASGSALELEPGDTIADWIIKTYVKTAVVSGSASLLRDAVLRMGGKVSGGLLDEEAEESLWKQTKDERVERPENELGNPLAEKPTEEWRPRGASPSIASTNPEPAAAAESVPTEVPSAASQSAAAMTTPPRATVPMPAETSGATRPFTSPTEQSRCERQPPARMHESLMWPAPTVPTRPLYWTPTPPATSSGMVLLLCVVGATLPSMASEASRQSPVPFATQQQSARTGWLAERDFGARVITQAMARQSNKREPIADREGDTTAVAPQNPGPPSAARDPPPKTIIICQAYRSGSNRADLGLQVDPRCRLIFVLPEAENGGIRSNSHAEPAESATRF
jgi:hypothetical protein